MVCNPSPAWLLQLSPALDIIQVLLLVLGLDAAAPAAARLSLLHIRDFMLPTMAGTEPHLRLFKHVIYAVDPALAQHLQKVEPFFALAATLTLYAHEIEEYGDIARVFDFLLANEAVMPLYLYAAVRARSLFMTIPNKANACCRRS